MAAKRHGANLPVVGSSDFRSSGKRLAGVFILATDKPVRGETVAV
jgi:hypothetical protein